MKSLPNLLCLLFFLSSFVFLPSVFASGFYLKSIGSLDVQGSAYDHYWYTGVNPVISGVAPAGSEVTIIVDDVSTSVTSDEAGDWSYQSSIAEGDHSLTLSTPSSGSYTFTLTIGPTPESVGALQASQTPVAGNALPTYFLLSIATLLLLTPFAIVSWSQIRA